MDLVIRIKLATVTF